MSDPADEEAAAAAEPAARPRARKKKRAPAPSAQPDEKESEPAAPTDTWADSVPAFARTFPREPALDGLVQAFEAGDYARVRREGPDLAKKTESDEVRAAARELARRLDPDPVAAYLLAVAIALLAFLSAWYWLHPHGP